MKTGIINKIKNDSEYRIYMQLIILSSLTAIVEYVGSHMTHSNALSAGVVHMLLHIGFFVSAFWLTYITKENIASSFFTEKKILIISFVLIAIFIGIRLNDFIFHSLDLALTEEFNPVIFRITSIIALVLILFQYKLLHHGKNFTCSVLCHGSLAHLFIDLFTLSTLFFVSFANKKVFVIFDAFFFYAIGMFLVGAIFWNSVPKSIKNKLVKIKNYFSLKRG